MGLWVHRAPALHRAHADAVDGRFQPAAAAPPTTTGRDDPADQRVQDDQRVRRTPGAIDHDGEHDDLTNTQWDVRSWTLGQHCDDARTLAFIHRMQLGGSKPYTTRVGSEQAEAIRSRVVLPAALGPTSTVMRPADAVAARCQ